MRTDTHSGGKNERWTMNWTEGVETRQSVPVAGTIESWGTNGESVVRSRLLLILLFGVAASEARLRRLLSDFRIGAFDQGFEVVDLVVLILVDERRFAE